MNTSELKCPICNSYPVLDLMALDGGSSFCSNEKCGTSFHLCRATGTVDYLLLPRNCCNKDKEEVLKLRAIKLEHLNTCEVYNNLKSIELRDLCKKRGIKKYSKLSHADLVRLIVYEECKK
jgi:hypothetical protein